MADSGDSDVEILCGPLKLDEVKYYLLEEHPRRSSRTRSLNFNPTFSLYETSSNDFDHSRHADLHNSSLKESDDENNVFLDVRPRKASRKALSPLDMNKIPTLPNIKIESDEETKYYTCDETHTSSKKDESVIIISDDEYEDESEKQIVKSNVRPSFPKHMSFEDTDSDNCFDNTLDDIETLLRGELKFSDDEEQINTNVKDKSNIADEGTQTSMKKETPHVKSNINPPSTSLIPVKKQLKPTQEPLLKPKVSPFKTPVTPIYKSRQKYKNTVSPIAMYIKYSPTAPIMRKIQTKSKFASDNEQLSPENLTNNFDVPDIKLPEIIYKPGEKQFCSEQKMNLPLSIAKILTNPTVIKHEKRINCKIDANTVNQRLQLDIDLSDNEAGSSVDVSIVSQKQAFKEARLFQMNI